MKKRYWGCVFLCLCLLLSACGASLPEGSLPSVQNGQTMNGLFHYNIPEGWSTEKYGMTALLHFGGTKDSVDGGYLCVTVSDYVNADMTDESLVKSYIDDLFYNPGADQKEGQTDYFKIGEQHAGRANLTCEIYGDEMECTALSVAYGTSIYTFLYVHPGQDAGQRRCFMDALAASFEFDENATPSLIGEHHILEKDNRTELEGGKVFVEGTIKEVWTDEGVTFSVVDTQGSEWAVALGAYPKYSDLLPRHTLKGTVRVFGTLKGTFGDSKLPLIVFEKLTDPSIPKDYVPEDFLMDEDELTELIEKNGTATDFSTVQGGSLNGQMVYLDGIIKNFTSTGDKAVKFTFYQKTAAGLISQEVVCASAVCRSQSSLKTSGQGVRICGTVQDGSLTIARVKTVDAPFSLDEVKAADRAAFISQCQVLSYKAIARDPSAYYGTKVKFTGEVVQVVSGSTGYAYRVDVTYNGYFYTDTIYVEEKSTAQSAKKILKDDIITIYGTITLPKTYTTVLGAQVTIPQVNASYIDLVG